MLSPDVDYRDGRAIERGPSMVNQADVDWVTPPDMTDTVVRVKLTLELEIVTRQNQVVSY